MRQAFWRLRQPQRGERVLVLAVERPHLGFELRERRTVHGTGTRKALDERNFAGLEPAVHERRQEHLGEHEPAQRVAVQLRRYLLHLARMRKRPSQGARLAHR